MALEAMRFSMGLEAECKVRHEGRTSTGKARLEATDLSFRGDFRLSIPFGRITSLEADEGELAVEFDGGEAIFELGAAAEKWVRAIKKPKGRIDKLGVKPGLVVSVAGAREGGGPAEVGGALEKSFLTELKRRNIELSLGEVREGSDLIFVSFEEPADLARIAELKGSIKENGAIWVVRPKGQRELTEAEVMAAGRQAGLIDVKVVAFSETHTAEKFMLPSAARSSAEGDAEADEDAVAAPPPRTAEPPAQKAAPVKKSADPPKAAAAKPSAPPPTVAAAKPSAPPTKAAAPSKSAPPAKAAAPNKSAPPTKAAAPSKSAPLTKKSAPLSKKSAPLTKPAAPGKSAPLTKAAAAKKSAPPPKAAVAKKSAPPPKVATPSKASAGKKSATPTKAVTSSKASPAKKTATKAAARSRR